MHLTRLTHALIAALALTLTACGAAAAPTPSPTPLTIPTDTPTATPLPTVPPLTLTEVPDTPEVGFQIGLRAPDFHTVDAEGEPIALSDLRGQVVLLNFWATWCGPCRVEMPVFEAEYQARAEDGFTVLAVNSGETLDDVLDFRDQLGLSFPLALDSDGAISMQYALFSLPTTFLIDAEGVIVHRHFGPLTDDQIAEMLDSALGDA